MSLMTDATQTTEGDASQGADAAAASAAAAAAAKDTGTAADQKATEGEQKVDDKAPVVPEAYEDFTVPEGQELPEDLSTELKGLAKDLKLTQEQAQKLADVALARSSKAAEAQATQIAKLSTEWATSAKVDKEFGGDKFDANLAVAKRALDAFGSTELKDLLNGSGLGNHPEVIRLFLRVGSKISEDSFVAASGGTSGSDSVAKRLFPNMN